jgi:SAM-dependent methyltransferase
VADTTKQMPTAIKRLNWGCGHRGVPGWINSDRKEGRGIDISGDVLSGLPIPDGEMDYVVSIHALPEVAYTDLVPVLRELRRVLKPGGVLRLGLPDLIKGIRAYEEGDASYFLIPDDDARSLGAKLITQLVWYGYSRTLFTSDFIEEMLAKAGFTAIRHCDYGQTFSAHPGIIELDDRERESLFVEATK